MRFTITLYPCRCNCVIVSWALPGPDGAATAGAARPRTAAINPRQAQWHIRTSSWGAFYLVIFASSRRSFPIRTRV